MDETYRKCLNALYGNGEPPTAAEVKAAIAKKKNSVTGLEQDEQVKFVVWAKKKGFLIAAIPNGGYRNKREAYSLKLSGVSSGFPDLFIPMPHKKWHGLFIEMKRKRGGVTSSAQLWWIEQLRKQGYCAEICAGFEQAVKVTEDYFN